MHKLSFIFTLAFLVSCGSKSSALSGDGQTAVAPVKATPKSSDAVPEAVTYSSPPAPKSVVPERAVAQGNFQAWLEPPNPAPFQEYAIWIKVTLPEEAISAYSVKDLSGTVVGSDDYRASFGASFGIGNFEKLPDGALFYVSVPGGGRFVNDSVQVQSLLLKENQVLKLTFEVAK